MEGKKIGPAEETARRAARRRRVPGLFKRRRAVVVMEDISIREVSFGVGIVFDDALLLIRVDCWPCWVDRV